MLLPRRYLLLISAGMLVPTIPLAASDASRPDVPTKSTLFRSSPAMDIYRSRLPEVNEPSATPPTQTSNEQLHIVQPYLEPRSLCYTMRSYKFKYQNAPDNALLPSGASTCEAASTFSLKDAVWPR